MDFKQLESFITIAKYNSFSKAARELYLTQPTLSNHIQNLEKELGTLLFERKGKTIELTPAGKTFKDHAIEIIKKRDSAIFNINDIIGKFDGLVELPCSSVPSEFVLPDIISNFLRNYPGVRFKIHHMDSQDVIDAISDNKYSMGFIGSKPSNEYEYIEVFSDSMVLIGPASQKRNSTTITFDEIITLPLITREEGSGSGKIFSSETKRRGLPFSSLNIVVVSENFNVTKKLVANGVGYSVIPKSTASEIPKDSNIITYDITDVETRRSFYFIIPKKAVLTPIEIKFNDFIVNTFK